MELPHGNLDGIAVYERTIAQKRRQLGLWDDRTYDGMKARAFKPPPAATGYSTCYHRWLNSPQKDRQRAEVLSRQRWACWECRQPLRAGRVQLHHVLGYGSLNYEEASDLAGLHGLCHRRVHERQQKWRGC